MVKRRSYPQAVTSPHSLCNRLARVVWGVVWLLFYRPSPRMMHGWRRLLLRIFGARLHGKPRPYPSARIWAPWNLEMGHLSCLGDYVDCYCVDKVVLHAHALVSQYSVICTATHDHTQIDLPLVTAPVVVGERAWVCADVFISPGVSIGQGAVVGARSSVFRSIQPWTIAFGNPACEIRPRELAPATLKRAA